MKEIRPIRQGEAETFLHLLCDVFGLDYHRAQSIFFTEPLFDLDRKWALFDDGEMVSILTTVPVEFGWGRAIGIAGVATRENRRKTGLASELLETVLRESEKRGETGALLFAKEEGVYDRVGFKTIDHVVRGHVAGATNDNAGGVLTYQEVRDIYDRWSHSDPARIRRNDQRWTYWKWNLRICSRHEGGYLCIEGGLIREAVLPHSTANWPIGTTTEWFGTTHMAECLGIQLLNPTVDLFLMARNVPMPPQMFMTDQF